MTTFRNARFDKQLIETYGDVKIYTVNGAAVRSSSLTDEEFTGSGSWLFYKFIPTNEVWVDRESDEVEELIRFEIYQIKFHYMGYGKNRAYAAAIKLDRAHRQKVIGNHQADKDISAKVIIEKFGYNIDQKIAFWLVNGDKVRTFSPKTDFFLGGNDVAYDWMPPKNIWLEDGYTSELVTTGLHELSERTAMYYLKLSYKKAHPIASKVEFKHRGKMTKDQLLGLSKDDVLTLIKEVQ